MKGKVRTVLGDVNPEDLGRVLPHEHLEVESANVLRVKPLYKPELSDCDFSLQNLGWIRQFPYSHPSNLNVSGQLVREVIKKEAKQFQSFGGGTIVENTNYTMRTSSSFQLAKDINQEIGVHIIFGTGFYVTSCHAESTRQMSIKSMVHFMTKDILEGCEDDSSVKCGILGEVGCSWPLTDFERKSLKAAAEVEMSCGCPVMIHPGRNPSAPEEIVRLFSEAGGNPRRLVMGHLDRTIHAHEDVLEFAKMGTFLEYDLFGNEVSFYQHDEEAVMPSDAQRIGSILALLNEGYEDRVLMSHDMHTKHRLEHFGGHGFSHIFRDVVPRMLNKGISQQVIDKITIHNPASWLTFQK